MKMMAFGYGHTAQKAPLPIRIQAALVLGWATTRESAVPYPLPFLGTCGSLLVIHHTLRANFLKEFLLKLSFNFWVSMFPSRESGKK
jgi:hypothetical protein